MTAVPVQPPVPGLPVPLPPRAIPPAKPRWPRSLIPSPSTRRRWLRRLNPLGLLPGAVFEKEVRVQGRRWGTYIARGGYGLLLLGVMSILFAVFVSEQSHQSGARGVQEFQTLAPSMTTAVLWFQFVVLTLIAPLLLGPAICDEKRTGTLATLLTTPLTAAQIILGKLAGGLVQIIILALIATPMLMVIRVFGGVPASAIVAGLSVGLSMAILAACLALAASVCARRGTTAAVSGLILALAFHGIPPLAMGLIRWKFKINIPWDYMIATSSPMEMAVVSTDLLGGGGPPVRTQWLWAWNSLYSLSIGALAILFATVRLRRVMIREGAGAPAAPTAMLTQAPRPGSPAPATAPGAVAQQAKAATIRERRVRDVGQRPVLWREVRQPVFSRKWQLPVLAVAIAGLMFWVYDAVGVNDREVHVVVAVIGMILAMLFAAVVPVAAITGEREARTWETLLTTRLSAREIVLGKIVGALKRQWVIPAILAVNFLAAGILTGTLRPVFLLHYALLLAAPAIFLSSTGVLASLLVKRSVQAAVLNTGLALVIWAGLPILFVLVDNLTRRLHMQSDLELMLVVSNPVPLAVSAVQGAGIHPPRGLPASRYHLPGFDWRTGVDTGTFTLVVFLHFAIYAALAAGAFILAVRGFKRWGGRT